MARRSVLISLTDGGPGQPRRDTAEFDLVLVISGARQQALDASVLHPPVHLLAPAQSGKQHMILSAAPFTAGARHDLMIEAFRQLVSDGTQCELHLAGLLRPEPKHRAYYLSVMSAAEGLPVIVHANIGPAELEGLYAQSSIYWDMAGDPADAAIVTAMSAGCIPVALAGRAARDVITDGLDGRLAADVTDLVQTTRLMLGEPAFAEAMRHGAAASAQRHGDAAFATSVLALAQPLLDGPRL